MDREPGHDRVVASPGGSPSRQSGGREVRLDDLPAPRLGGEALLAAASIGSEKSTSTPVDVGIQVEQQLGEAAVAGAEVDRTGGRRGRRA